MRLVKCCLLLTMALCMAVMVSCSRESSIKENVNLRNNHSVVFAFNRPFDDPEAFADSIINLSNPDSVLVYDTVTITVNDTIYLMGFLRYNANKIYRYIWHYEEPYSEEKMKDSTVEKSDNVECRFYFSKAPEKGCIQYNANGSNATAVYRVYPDAGVYSPLFIAIDGNNARDTAGIGQYIRVIDTPPYLHVPKDTLWTRAKSSITFPISAIDSFGTVTSIKVDLDASGSGKAKEWKYEDLGDSLLITIEYDSTNVDSLGNQMIYVIATDDDNNETKDSVYLHFNQVPVLKIISPEDSSTQSETDYLILHYEATDADNPASLRFYVRAANPIPSDTSYEEFVPTLSDKYLIAENLKDPYFVAINANGENMLGLSGRIYWDVWVTDGYDTVFADKIKDGESSRPRTFLLVDLKNPYGVFRGYAQYQGHSSNNHKGIFISVQDSVNTYTTTTDEKGYFVVNVPAGAYKITAKDTTDNGYTTEVVSNLHVELGQTRTIQTITLKDTISPEIEVDYYKDTLSTRKLELTGKILDIGSQVKEVSATLDDEDVENIHLNSYIPLLNKWAWESTLEELKDGAHTFKITATDSAGLSSSKTIKFYVVATTLSLDVEGQTSKLADSETLKFNAKVNNASPMPETIYWVTNISKADTFKVAVKDGAATLNLKKSELPSSVQTGRFYEMTAYTSQKGGVKSNTVRFGFLGDGPAIYFYEPSNDTTISLNDEIKIKVESIANNTDPDDQTATITWKCVDEKSCISDNAKEGTYSWSTAGTKKIIVKIVNAGDKDAYDTLIVNVVKDPPSIKISSDVNKDRIKIKSKLDIKVNASDKYGTINEIKWGCGKDKAVLSKDSTLKEPQKTISNGIITVEMDTIATNNYKCAVQVIDDDGQTSSDTLTFTVRKDLPFVALNIKETYVTVNDEVDFKFFAKDTLGTIVKYEKNCTKTVGNIGDSWLDFTPPTTVTMDPMEGTFYCAIQVTDDDGNTSRDTTIYHILQAPPTAEIIAASHATINDTLTLTSKASDMNMYNNVVLQGSLVKYEWGCGKKGSSIPFTKTGSFVPEFQVILPSTEQTYQCILQVTDDDGNTASATTDINVLLAPPTVTVKDEYLVTWNDVDIELDATAYDSYEGFITKREWSCGTSLDVENNWKTVSNLKTTWHINSSSTEVMCIVRVTDDDKNTARDTTHVRIQSDVPVISVTDKVIYVTAGLSFNLSASVSCTDPAWKESDLEKFKWNCYYEDSKKIVNDKENEYYYEEGFPMDRDGSYTVDGKNIFCYVTASQKGTSGILKSDTTHVIISKQLPVGVISAADTVYLWSGDKTVTDEALYYYTDEWGGQNSELGLLGDKNNQVFRWHFSNVAGGFYESNKDGSLDTSTAQFNKAFKRDTIENDIEICLDYRDSTKNANVDTTHYFALHRASTVCRNVYFRKAWRNLATPDTVLEFSKMTTQPVIQAHNNNVIAAYLTEQNKVSSKYYNGSKWTSISTSSISVEDSITKIKLTSNGTDAYMAILTKAGNVAVYQSAGGTSAWADMKLSLTGADSSSLGLTCKSSGPIVAYIDKEKSLPHFYAYNSSAWKKYDVSSKSTKVRLINAAVSSDGVLVIVYVDKSSDYNGYYNTFSSNFTEKAQKQSLRIGMDGIDLAVDGKTLYIGYLYRDTENYGPTVAQATIAEGSLSLSTQNYFTKPFAPNTFAYRISVAAKSGKVYVTIDDNEQPSLSQTNVYTLDATTWKIYGENLLPYSKTVFYNTHGYYLRGSMPDITITDNGKLHVSMLAWQNATVDGQAVRNFGPIVMKYVADSWTVNDYSNKD